MNFLIFSLIVVLVTPQSTVLTTPGLGDYISQALSLDYTPTAAKPYPTFISATVVLFSSFSHDAWVSCFYTRGPDPTAQIAFVPPGQCLGLPSQDGDYVPIFTGSLEPRVHRVYATLTPPRWPLYQPYLSCCINRRYDFNSDPDLTVTVTVVLQ